MRIGISCYPTYGGSGVVATELGLKLADRGHEVHFLSYAIPQRLDRFHPNVFFHEVLVPSYPLFEYPPYSLALASIMAEVVSNRQLDLLHCHYALPHAASAYLAKQMTGGRVRVVTTLHGTDITLVGNDRSFLSITRFCIESSDAVTAVSEYLEERTRKEFGIAGPIEVVPNFVDPDEFRRTPQSGCRSMIKPAGEKVLIHVSNFRPVKRLRDVVQVFARVVERIPARLVLVGDGPERPATEAACRDLKVLDRVLFLGKQSDLPPLLSCSDLLLLPSLSESFGLVALEAMACEVPVVGYRSGGLPEVVEDGVTGSLAPPGDVERLAALAVAILEEPDRARSMAEAGRKAAVERFHPDQVVRRYEEVYERVLRDARPAP